MAAPDASPGGARRPAPAGPPRERAALRAIAASYITGTVAGPRGWEQLLTVAASGLPYGFTGALLIAAQQSEPVTVASYDDWYAAGWRIKGQHAGLWTLAGPDQRPTALFARSQVRPARARENPLLPGRAVPYHHEPADADRVVGALTADARRRRFTVTRPAGETGPGHTDWGQRHIIIPAAIPDAAAAAALARELAYITAAGNRLPVSGTTAGIDGTPAIGARSAAWLTLARLGLDPAAAGLAFPPARTWAAPDPRSPLAGILTAVGERATAAAAVICQHAEKILADLPPAPVTAPVPDQAASAEQRPAARPRRPARTSVRTAVADSGGVWPVPDQQLVAVNLAAAQFYRAHLPGSWADGYLAGRGFGAGIARRWHLGYAPAGWTGLLDHLRAAGFSDDVLTAAGLARRSRRTGHLIDVFRDRIIIPLRGPHGQVIGFAGRARDGVPPGTPKYLNTAGTAIYRKGSVFFGLAEAGSLLDRGARPVLVEGYLDAIAVTEAGGGRLAGLAPGGTALTRAQMQDLGSVYDFGRYPLLVARDADTGGRKATLRDYEIVAFFSPDATTPVLPDGADPADLFQEGPQVLAAGLVVGERPLADVAVGAVLREWEGKLQFAEGQLGAVRHAARLLAKAPPQNMARQIAGLAARTGLPHEAVLAEVADALKARSSPKARPQQAAQGRRAVPSRPRDFPQPPALGRAGRGRHAATAPRQAGGRRTRHR